MIARRLSICAAFCLMTFAVGVQAGAQDKAPQERYGDVSNYTRFLIYPHQQRAYEAMRKGDAKTAIKEFEHARALAPKSVGTALDLATAYERFGQAARARDVLAQQLKLSPKDPLLVAALQALDTEASPVDCTRDASNVCRAHRGYEVLRSGRLEQAEHELDNKAFAQSPEGVSLRRALAQRAIHLGDMERAARQFAELERMHKINQAERGQWFNVLLALDRPQRARALQKRGHLDSMEQRLALAQLLERRGDLPVLAGYLRTHAPDFGDSNAREEQQWIYLLQRVVRLQPRLLRDYKPHTGPGRRLQAQLSLSQAMSGRDWGWADRMLQRLPENDYLDERFELALQSGRFDQALKYGRMLDKDRSGKLDALTYRLMQAGGDAQATRWLLEDYPYPQASDRGALFERLALLASAHPAWFDDKDRVRLREPQTDPVVQAGQLRLWMALEDCKGLRSLVGKPFPGTTARAWRALGECYRAQRSGLAQYAYAQAYRLQPDAGNARALAYQAFTNHDYATALGTWRALPPESLLADDLLAAANTALDAGQRTEARAWLDSYADRVDKPGDRYWWLRARSQPDNRLADTAADLRKAIGLRPDPVYYIRLADVEQKRSRPREALDALLRAQALQPHNAELARRIGYAYLRQGQVDPAIKQFELARSSAPGDTTLVRELMYLNQERGDRAEAQRYAALAIDRFDARATPRQDVAQDQQRFALRRMHEELGRRWSVDADLILGDTISSAANPIAPGVSYRSYFQAEAQYRFGDSWPTGGGLAAYARVFAGSGQQGDLWPTHAPMLGVGMHWKPSRKHNLVVSLERQHPLDNHAYTRNDTMARVSYSTSFLDRFNQDWRPGKRAWMTQNLYLDLAHYFSGRQTVGTADYRIGMHRRIAQGQTVEPYAHVQFNGLDQGRGGGFDRDVRVGAGMRWNLWYGESRYDAYRHRFSVGLEVQHAFTSYLPERNAVYLTVGKHW